MTPKQKAIYQFVFKQGEATKSQIVKEFHVWYYANAGKHIGAILTRMVNDKTIRFARKGRGNYHIPTLNPSTTQIGLFAQKED